MPVICDYSRFLSFSGARRKQTEIRKMISLQAKEGEDAFLNFGGGVPNFETVPIKDISLTLRDGNKIEFKDASLKKAISYGNTSGISTLREHIKKLVEYEYDPPTAKYAQSDEASLSYCVTSGSQYACYQMVNMCLGKGDHVLVDEECYAAVLSEINAIGAKSVHVKSDGHGMCPDDLRNKLSRWSPEEANNTESDIPRLMYLSTCGNNPTGTILSPERQEEIYKICQEYNILIFEDDAYYFLQFERPRVKPFLSIDVDGRVVRAETFSKTISSGLRVGFVCGPKRMIERLDTFSMTSTMVPCVLSQSIISRIFDIWGLEGFIQNCNRIADFYKAKVEMMDRIASKHLSGIARWDKPKSGMFFWIELLTIEDSRVVFEKLLDKKILVVIGSSFTSNVTKPSNKLRLSISQPNYNDMEKLFQTLAEILKN